MKITYDTGFTQMPNNILRSHTLKPLHKVVLSVICSYSNSSNLPSRLIRRLLMTAESAGERLLIL